MLRNKDRFQNPARTHVSQGHHYRGLRGLSQFYGMSRCCSLTMAATVSSSLTTVFQIQEVNRQRCWTEIKSS